MKSLLFVFLPYIAPTLVFTEPKANTTWHQGTAANITWEPAPNTTVTPMAPTFIQLVKGDPKNWTVVAVLAGPIPERTARLSVNVSEAWGAGKFALRSNQTVSPLFTVEGKSKPEDKPKVPDTPPVKAPEKKADKPAAPPADDKDNSASRLAGTLWLGLMCMWNL